MKRCPLTQDKGFRGLGCRVRLTLLLDQLYSSKQTRFQNTPSPNSRAAKNMNPCITSETNSLPLTLGQKIRSS